MSQPQVIPAPAAPQARPATGSAKHDVAAPPGDGFAPALADAVAGTGPPGRPVDAKATRTAVAEGDQAGSDSSGAGDDAASAAAAGDAAAPAVVALAANAVALPCVETPAVAPVATNAEASTAPAVEAPAAAAPPSPDAAPVPPGQAAQISLAGDAADVQPPAASAKPAPTPEPPLIAAAKDDVVETSTSATSETDVRRGDGADKASLAPNPPTAPAPASRSQEAPATGAPQPQTQPPQTATPSAPAHGAPAHANATAPPASMTVPGTAAPGNAAPPEPVPAQGTEIPSPVRLSELAQAARTAITVTARQGGTIARIVLHPRELGTVEIRLSYAPDGISATVRADSPQAAQALAQGGSDLRQALASHGLDLLDLDIRDRRSGNGSHHPSSHSRPADPDDRHASPDEREIAVDAVRLPMIGSQIDVLA